MIVSSSTAALGVSFHHAFHSKAKPLQCANDASSFSQLHSIMLIASQTSDPFTRLSRAAQAARRGLILSFRHHIVQMVEHLEYTMAQATDMTLRS